MTVDSFKWLPPALANYYKGMAIQKEEVPWAPLTKPLSQCRFSLLSTSGIYLKGKQPPFDLDRERREPFWGDPSYRAIPRDVRQEEIGVAHLHINTSDIEADMNIALPVHRFLEQKRRARSAPWRRPATPSWASSRARMSGERDTAPK